MTCEVCGKTMKDGVTFIRQNEKDVKGVWRCLDCNKLAIDIVTRSIISALAKAEQPKEQG